MVARYSLASSIDSFLSGNIDNWSFDDDIFAVKTSDSLCLEIRRQLWLLYDDTRRYFHVEGKLLPADYIQMVHRWQCLLRSNVEWAAITKDRKDVEQSNWLSRFIRPRKSPKCAFKHNSFWPFANLDEWRMFQRAHEPLDGNTAIA
jgi:hypothetical protein